MKQMRALLYKEWRDQRALVLGSLVLVAALLAAAKILTGKRFDLVLREDGIYPAVLGVFCVALATETISREAGNGTECTSLRLPATRALLWSAKSVFCLSAFACCLAFLAVAEIALRVFEHRLSTPLQPTLVHPMYLLSVLCAANACLAAACVLKSSLRAAITGLAAVAAVPLLAILLPVTRATEWIDLCFNSLKPHELAGVGALAFGLGSLLAFAVRRADRFGLRRAGAAVLGTGIILGPVLAATMHRAAWALDIERGSPHARIARAEPSPDGRFVAVEAVQEWTPRQEWLTLSGKITGSRCRVRREVWILDCDSGVWNEIDDRFRMLADQPVWDERGRLHAISLPGAFGEDPHRLETIDPRARTLTSEVPGKLTDCLGRWWSYAGGKNGTVIEWKARNIRLRLAEDSRYRCAREPGIVFHEVDGYIVRHQLEPDCTTRILAVAGKPSSFWNLTPDDSMLYDYTQRVLVDACDGHVVHAFDSSSSFYGRSSVAGQVCWIEHAGDRFTILHEDGSETPLPFDDHSWQEFGADKALHVDEHTIECMKLDGSEHRVLYQAGP